MDPNQPRGTRILLVDDEADFRNIMALSFERRGYQVLSASNGTEAFEIIQSNPVDVVVSDIRMPGGDGVELLEKTRAHHISTPVILLVTGYADISTDDAHNKGAEALFSKPFDRKVLEETISRLLTPPEERWGRISGKADFELNVELQFQGLTQAIEAKVVNLGRGGMFVTLLQQSFPNICDTVDFKLDFGEQTQTVQGNGIVRWVRTKSSSHLPPGCGIEFTYLEELARQQVLEYVNETQPKAYIPNR